MTTAARDQLDAATAEAQRAIDSAVLEHGYLPSAARPDPWLLALVVHAVSDTCEHVARMRSPEPVLISAHLRRTECGPCNTRASVAMRGTPEDDTCDRCRTIPANRRLTSLVAAFGPALVPMALCDHCVPALDADGTAGNDR